MSDQNAEQLAKDALSEQNRKIEEFKQACVDTYGKNVLNNTRPIYNTSTNSFYCPASFDGITCWPPVRGGTIAKKNCSSLFYVQGFNVENTASKICLADGNWLQKDGNYWTNFTQCHQDNYTTTILKNNKIQDVPTLLKDYLPLLKAIKQVGYSVSLVTLIIAILIMVTNKKLHCTRNILHIHLFASFILRAFVYLLKDAIFVDGLGMPADILRSKNASYFHIHLMTNKWQCKSLTSMWQYFTMANYCWILMEGLYLHNLIFRALFADTNGSILGYVAMGWGFPFLVVIPWILGRIFLEDSLCWTTNNTSIHLILELSTLASVVVNLIFFIRISMVLLNKVKSPMNDDNRKSYMKWAKSTLVLVPLFGVNYVVFFGLKFITNVVVELIWIICDSLFGSFQGFFVAVLYCFMNGEVKTELKPFIHGILPFLANNRLSRACFPCREKFMRSTKGRISVCTTLSCSSMYANGMIHNPSRNNVKSRDHFCSKRSSQEILTSDSAGTSIHGNSSRNTNNHIRHLNTAESLELTNLFHQDIRRHPEEYISMLSKQC